MFLGAGISVLAIAVGIGGGLLLQSRRAHFLEGWRPGQVVEVDLEAAIHVPLSRDCRQQPSTETVATQRYVVVLYRSTLRSYRNRVVPLPKGLELRVGDRVQVNIDRCEDALIIDPAA
jgi:hypothetical protein